MLKAIWRFPYGEAILWVLFLGTSLAALGEYASANAPTVAIGFALAAIGVRATRTERPSDAK